MITIIIISLCILIITAIATYSYKYGKASKELKEAEKEKAGRELLNGICKKINHTSIAYWVARLQSYSNKRK